MDKSVRHGYIALRTPYAFNCLLKATHCNRFIYSQKVNSPEDQQSHDNKRDNPSGTSSRKEFMLLAKDLSREDLLEFIFDECNQDPSLQVAFLLRFISGTEDVPSLDYVDLINKVLERSTNDWGTIDDSPVNSALERLNQRALKLYHNGHFSEVLKISQAVMTLFPGIRPVLKDGPGEIHDGLIFALEILGKLFALPTEPQLEIQAREFGIDLLVDKALDTWGIDDILWDQFYQLSLSQPDRERLLQLIDHNISSLSFTPQDPEWEMTDWLLRKYEIAKRDPNCSDPLALMKPYLNFAEIRELFVEDALEKGRLERAKELLREGIEQAKRKEKQGTVHQWTDKMLQVAIQENDLRTIRNLAGRLFLSEGKLDFSYYDILKSTYSPSEWKFKYEELIAGIGGGETEIHYSQAHAIAVILTKENELERLLDLLRQNTLSYDLIKAHYEALESEYSVEIIHIFQLSIEEYARDHTGRSAYYKLVQMLRTMSQIEGTASIIRSMVKSFRQRYARRPAMMEILDMEFSKGG